MDERRTTPRKRVIYGAAAKRDATSAGRKCVVRNVSDGGARVEFGSTVGLPEDIELTIAQTSSSYRSRVMWTEDNSVGIAFSGDTPARTPNRELEERLRIAEKKARRLRRRVLELTGGA